MTCVISVYTPFEFSFTTEEQNTGLLFAFWDLFSTLIFSIDILVNLNTKVEIVDKRTGRRSCSFGRAGRARWSVQNKFGTSFPDFGLSLLAFEALAEIYKVYVLKKTCVSILIFLLVMLVSENFPIFSDCFDASARKRRRRRQIPHGGIIRFQCSVLVTVLSITLIHLSFSPTLFHPGKNRHHFQISELSFPYLFS